MRRREFLGTLAAASVAAATKAQTPPPAPHTGRVKQALMRVNFGRDTTRSFDEMCGEAAVNRVKAHAEDKNVGICIEVVNSKYTDPEFGRADAIFDHLEWGADVCRRVNSPRVRILFDIYHVQIMEGDVCANIRKFFPLIAHFHAAGVPGRRELDDTQELNYRFVAQTIAELGFTGYIAHEYRPSPGHDPIDSLGRCLTIIDV